MQDEPVTTPSIAPPSIQVNSQSILSSRNSSIASTTEDDKTAGLRAERPKLGSRQSSGTMIVTRDQPTVIEDQYDDNDVRTMSPRRNSSEVEKLSDEARRDLIEQAKVLQTTLEAIVERVETVKEEHEKLEGGNKFLQSYIGELMQTTKITSSAPSKSKGKARTGK